MKKSLIKTICLLLIIGLNWAGISAVGRTFAYFSDTETSSENSFSAGTLDFSLRSGQNNFVPSEIASNMSPCNQLQLKIWYNHYLGPPSGGYDNRDMRLKYNGPLTSLANLTDVDFIIPHPDDHFDTDPSDGTEQWFYYSIVVPNDIAVSFQGEVCEFKFVFEGWQDNIDNYGDGGFTDVEEIENTIKIGYWNPPVVLNEFLPNSGDYPEFIELYNKTASSIDLNGFYIKANGNTIPINTTTTSAYSGSSTTILANGWLVITTGGNLINDSSGTIALYNENDVLVDSYTYGSPDHNINNTPGWTNNLVGYWPFDGNLEDKSGNGNNGTNYGATSGTGKINQALSFDGTDDYVEILHSSSVDISGDKITLETWIKAHALPADGERWVILNKNHAYALQIADSGKVRVWLGPLTTFVQTDNPEISTGVWYHLVGVYDGSSVKIYVNGTLKKEVTKSGDQASSGNSITIGAKPSEGYFNGIIDEVKIYDRALDALEISAHYDDAGSLGAVPQDKSFARIPDGADNWVDPIPTPGGPNILESEIINQEEAIEGEPIVEEPIAEELPVEETPVAEEEPVNEGEPVIEEEPVEEEVTTEENQGQGGIIDEINEIIDEVIDEIVDEIMPEETISDNGSTNENEENIVIDETTVIEETTNPEENPVIEQQPDAEPQDTIIPADNNYSESNSDNINADKGSSINPDSGSSNSSGESSGDSSSVTGEINSAIA